MLLTYVTSILKYGILFMDFFFFALIGFFKKSFHHVNKAHAQAGPALTEALIHWTSARRSRPWAESEGLGE